jgi:hypothetical protein
VVVEFAVTGVGGGILSQPRALTDSAGEAETYLLETRSGPTTLLARSGTAATSASFPILRAPGELRFQESSGRVGLPLRPHPDSVVRVRLLDTEGDPLEGVGVWFAGPGRFSRFVDTTDSRGWAETVLQRSGPSAGEGRIFAFIPGLAGLTATSPRPVEAAAERVVLVSVDGLRADALERWSPPVLRRLAREGAAAQRARTVTPSLTAPAHLSLLSGVPPPDHGVFGDEIVFNEAMARLEPLFREGAREGLDTRAFLSREGPLEAFETALRCSLAFGLDSLELVEPEGPRVAAAAIPALRDPEVEMVFIHLPDPDVAGHAHGWSSPEYGAAVLRADSALALLVDELGPADLLAVTAPHGGGGAYGDHLHGSTSEEDMRIPLILWGARVTSGSPPEDATILDVAPTLLWALGFEAPAQYQGRPLVEAFR